LLLNQNCAMVLAIKAAFLLQPSTAAKPGCSIQVHAATQLHTLPSYVLGVQIVLQRYSR
jgi:hypothetical protein